FEHPTLLSIVLQALRSEDGHIIDWIYADANKNALGLLNRTREALLGKRLSEVVPDRAERLMKMCAQVMTTQEPVRYESHFASRDFLTCLFPAGSNSVVSSGIDVTARNSAEREVHRLIDELCAEKEWLFAVLNGIREEVYFTDPQGRYTYANPAVLREFGHESLSGVPVETVVADLVVLRADGTPRPLEEAPPLRAIRGECITNEEQIVRIPRTGEFRHREVSSAPVRNTNGQIIGAVSVVRDVTETRQAAAKLRAAVDEARMAEAESRATLAAELVAMQRLHDISTEAMTANDQQALLEKILDATIALHGAASGSVQLMDTEQQTLRMAAHRGMDEETLKRFAEVDACSHTTCGVALARRERVIIEDVGSDASGIVDPEVAQRMGLRAVQSTPLFTADGAILGMLSTQFASPRRFSQDELRLTDLYARQAGMVIERKRAEIALITAREEADLANKAKSHFVRAVSHDLRQSVQALTLLNGALSTNTLDASGRAALKQQSETIDTMTHLLDALLNISKLESGAVAPELSDFSVTTLFEKLRREFSILAANKSLELQIDAPSQQTIRSDPTLVGEILRNFLSNAIKFTSQGTVKLRCSPAGSTVRLEVIDTGIGISRDELPRIFGEFYQVGVSATLGREGYGLGLGIVQRIAMLLKADIEVDSEPGKGSTFSVSVPQGEPDLAIRPAPVATQRASNEVATLLLVEDDQKVRASMQLFFKSYGYRVVPAASLDEALAVVGTFPRPDLLITDFHLQTGKTGSDVIRCIREVLGESFPAILISGDTSAEIEDLPHDAGVRFASKPIDPERLVTLVQDLLVGARSNAKQAVRADGESHGVRPESCV
ncbi:MAG: ATP-binding protein, partial [Povalibacter sp.]